MRASGSSPARRSSPSTSWRARSSIPGARRRSRVDPESPELKRPLADETREEYRAAFAAWRAEQARAWRDAGASYFEVATDEGADHAIRRIASPAAVQARGA